MTRAGWIRRPALWAPLVALVVLALRTLVYALVPQPTLDQPRPVPGRTSSDLEEESNT